MRLPGYRAATPLPLPPVALLKQHQVHERYDNRFRACARLLQALWRERQGLPIGVHRSRAGRPRKLGSRLSAAAAIAGRNFLSPAIAQLARRELAYQEVGALIERERLFGNLLSSTSLALNACAPLRADPGLAARVLRLLLPDLDLTRMTALQFEHSPGRGEVAYVGDKTAFDVAIFYETSTARRGGLFLEWKYADELHGTGTLADHPRYDELAEASGLFKAPMHAALRLGGQQQLFREHLLAQSMVMRGDLDEATFVLVAPADSLRVQQAARLYAAQLVPPLSGQVRFANRTLERFVAALGQAGATDHGWALFDRYLDWRQIDAAVAASLAVPGPNWRLKPPLRAVPVLLAQVA